MTCTTNLPPLPEPIGWAAESDLALQCAAVFLTPLAEQLRAMIDAGWVAIYTAAQVEEIRRAAVLAERDRFRAMFDEALSDHSITWPGEVDILYEKMFPAAAIREGGK